MATKKTAQGTPKKKSTSESKSSTTYRATLPTKLPSLLDDMDFLLPEPEPAKERSNKISLVITAGVTAIITALLTLGLTQQISPTLSDRTTLSAQTSGGVCLTEDELRNLIKENKIQAYWTGPIKDGSYTLNSSTPGQTFIRYVPEGEKCDDLSPDFRVIATYEEPDAFATTEAAGTTADGVSLLNTDGSIVYFNKNTPTNIYLAYPGMSFQIEVYDPDPKEAISLATRQGSIEMIQE